MLSAALIVFREALEVVLVLGIVLAYLGRTHHPKYKRYVYSGLLSAVLGSVLFAWLFLAVKGSFSGTSEMIFEGTTMLIASVLITITVFWMLARKHAKQEIEQELAGEISQRDALGIFILVFFTALRDGVETVVFLVASASGARDTLIGGIVGICAALALGYAVFVLFKHIDIKRLFAVTSVLLILFAAGLVARGLGEYQEAGVVPPVIEHVYDITPGVNADGTFPVMHESGAVGSVFKDLFGYSTSPSLVQALAYIGYLLVVYLVWRGVDKKHAQAL